MARTEKSRTVQKRDPTIVEQTLTAIGAVVFDPYAVLKAPLSTEKSIKQIEFENKLAFTVDARATKQDVKKAVEELFKVKVTAVNIQNSVQGQKRAYVTLSKSNPASDVSADLGLI